MTREQFEAFRKALEEHLGVQDVQINVMVFQDRNPDVPGRHAEIVDRAAGLLDNPTVQTGCDICDPDRPLWASRAYAHGAYFGVLMDNPPAEKETTAAVGAATA